VCEALSFAVTNCGAMTAIASRMDLRHLPAVAGWLRHADAAKAVTESRIHSSQCACVDSMVRETVLVQLANLRTHSCVAVGLEGDRRCPHQAVCTVSDVGGVTGTLVSDFGSRMLS
jgi:carbonic anhydrase